VLISKKLGPVYTHTEIMDILYLKHHSSHVTLMAHQYIDDMTHIQCITSLPCNFIAWEINKTITVTGRQQEYDILVITIGHLKKVNKYFLKIYSVYMANIFTRSLTLDTVTALGRLRHPSM